MRGILTVFVKEFLENLRDRRTLLAALVLGPIFGPLLLAGLLQFMMQRGEASLDKPIKIAVVHAERAPNLLLYLAARGIEPVAETLDEAEARKAVLAKRHAAVLWIPEEFAARLAEARPAPVRLYTDASDEIRGREVSRRVQRVIDGYAQEISRSRLLLRGIDPLVTLPIVVQPVDVSTPASRASMLLGIMSYFVIFAMLAGGMYLAIDSTAGERERGSLEALLTMPLPRAHLIYGKILATCAYMFIALVLTVTACALTLQVTRLEEFGMSASLGPGETLATILLVAPLIPLAAALLTAVASYTRSFREAQSYLSFVIAVPTLPLAFIGLIGLSPSPLVMAVPSLGQHFLMMNILRGELPQLTEVALSAGTSLALGAMLVWFIGKRYEREAILG
jgi:sodium transport system permease protein